MKKRKSSTNWRKKSTIRTRRTTSCDRVYWIAENWQLGSEWPNQRRPRLHLERFDLERISVDLGPDHGRGRLAIEIDVDLRRPHSISRLYLARHDHCVRGMIDALGPHRRVRAPFHVLSPSLVRALFLGLELLVLVVVVSICSLLLLGRRFVHRPCILLPLRRLCASRTRYSRGPVLGF